MNPTPMPGKVIKAHRTEDADLANWCVNTGFPPDLYYALTLRQRDEFIRAVNRNRK